MFSLFRKHDRNPWLEKDRQDARRIVLITVTLAVAVLAALGMLIYALFES